MSERFVPESEAPNSFVRMVLANPLASILTVNVLITVFGGGMVYQKMQSALDAMNERVARVEEASTATARAVDGRMVSANARITASDEKSAAKFDSLSREISDLKVSTRGIEEAVKFLVQQEQRRWPKQ